MILKQLKFERKKKMTDEKIENAEMVMEDEEPKNFCDKYCECFWSTLYIEKKTSQAILFKENNEWKILVQSNLGCNNEKILHESVVVELTKEETPTNDNCYFVERIEGNIVIHDCDKADNESLKSKIAEALERCVDKSREIEHLKTHCKYFLEIVAEGLIDFE